MHAIDRLAVAFGEGQEREDRETAELSMDELSPAQVYVSGSPAPAVHSLSNPLLFTPQLPAQREDREAAEQSGRARSMIL